jgi:TP53 regulating kinase-like protein
MNKINSNINADKKSIQSNFIVSSAIKIDEGAEAIIFKSNLFLFPSIIKQRIEKKYRPKVLDEQLRFSRTKAEAKILFKAKKASVLCPYVFGVINDSIFMQFIEGKTLNKFKKVPNNLLKLAAFYLASLHKNDIVHGDYTFANLMLTNKKELFVIDFGLSFISKDDEDKAVDLLTMLKSLNKSKASLFAKYYSSYGLEHIVLLAKKIQKRARYENRA